MLEIDSDEIKVNAGLTAWQQAVANVKAPVFEEPKEGIWDGPAYFYSYSGLWFVSIPDKQTSEKDDKKLKIVIIILCLLVLAALLPAYLKGLYPDKL